jgi:hypothetical protein
MTVPASPPGLGFALLEPLDFGSPEDELGAVPARLDPQGMQAALGDELVHALTRAPIISAATDELTRSPSFPPSRPPANDRLAGSGE